jgi:hypothetical protein
MLHSPRHIALHMLEGTEPSPIQPRPDTVQLPCVQPPIRPQMLIIQRHQGHSDTVVTATQGVICLGDPLTQVSMGCLVQYLWGLFLTSFLYSFTQNNPQMSSTLNKPHIVTALAALTHKSL